MPKNTVYNNSKLYYIHGYQSDPNSTKAILLKEKLNAKAIKYRDCEPEDLVISDCLMSIKKEIKHDKNVVLIGSSLGGFLAAKTALEKSNVKQIILLNPAIIPHNVDITKIQGIPQRILSEIQDISLFKKKIDSDIFILAGTEDDVVPTSWVLEFAKIQEATVRFLYDDHRFSFNLEKLADSIRGVINKKH